MKLKRIITATMAVMFLFSAAANAAKVSSDAKVEAFSFALGDKTSISNTGHIAGETGMSFPNRGGQAEFGSEASNGAKGPGFSTGGIVLNGHAGVESTGPNEISGFAGTDGISFAQTGEAGDSWSKIKGGSEVKGFLQDPSISINPPDPIGNAHSNFQAGSSKDDGGMSFSSGGSENTFHLNIGRIGD